MEPIISILHGSQEQDDVCIKSPANPYLYTKAASSNGWKIARPTSDTLATKIVTCGLAAVQLSGNITESANRIIEYELGNNTLFKETQNGYTEKSTPSKTYQAFDPRIISAKIKDGTLSNGAKKAFTDCSGLVCVCVGYAGIKLGKVYTTATLAEALWDTGYFNNVTFQSCETLQYGDILVTGIQGHTVIVCSTNGSYNISNNDGTSLDKITLTPGTSYTINNTTDYTPYIAKKNVISHNVVHYKYNTEYETKTVTYIKDEIQYADQTQDTANTSLLSYPNLVEVPFVQVKLGDYTFGTYEKKETSVRYPNFIQSMEVKKINGEVNTYTITLVHKIEAGADPNLVDKILSSVGVGGKVYISYGDYNEPSFSYKEEESILLSCTSNVDFKNAQISYTLTCTSNATVLYSRLFSFVATSAKPSDVIKNVLLNSNNTYGLFDVFPAMKNQTFRNKCIASDDCVVDIPAKNSIDPLSYLNYLVTFMCSQEDGPSTTVKKINGDSSNTTTITHGALIGNDNTETDNVLKTATYKLCLYDTMLDEERVKNEGVQAGAYFKIIKISTTDGKKTLSTGNVYEVDVGFPTTGNVMNFSVKEDRSWSLLYKYASQYKETVYNIDKDGNLKTEYLPKIAIASSLNTMTEAQKTWWTNMTEFPIKATLTLKGLVTPIVLMDYVRINALFCGQRHVASGLYTITSQTDSISASGYRTTLELLRIAGDNAYIRKVETTKTVRIPVAVIGDEITDKGEEISSVAFASLKGLSTIMKAIKKFLSIGDSSEITSTTVDIQSYDTEPTETLYESTSSKSDVKDSDTFITNLAKYIKVYAPKYEIYAYSAIIGQAIAESGSGNNLSKLAANHYNFWGMSAGSKWTGETIKYASNSLTFRSYASFEGGVKGYFDFINTKNYSNLKGIRDPQVYAETIVADGWLGENDDPQGYIKNIMSVIKRYNLTQYDPT